MIWRLILTPEAGARLMHAVLVAAAAFGALLSPTITAVPTSAAAGPSSTATVSAGATLGGGGSPADPGSSGPGHGGLAPAGSDGPAFVGRTGTTLTLDGAPYRFAGINIYMAASGGTPDSCGGALYPDVGVPLSYLPRGAVFRFWAFQNFFVSNGRFEWTNFDRVLAIAAARGDKAIPVLANQYDYCDGAAKDIGWYQSGYESRVGAGEIVPYEQYVAAVVSRYANDPTIAMWQLVNEGQATNADGSCDETAALGALSSFSNTVGGLVHRIDSNHLVSLGTLAGYSGSGEQWCGAANGDYQTLMSSPGIDVCDFHDYGYPAEPMGQPATPNLESSIEMCHTDGKPIMVGETGIYASSDSDLPLRAAEFDAKLSAQFQAGVVGELAWTWAVKPQYQPFTSDSNYAVFAGDPTLGVLSRFTSSQ